MNCNFCTALKALRETTEQYLTNIDAKGLKRLYVSNATTF